jgi:hypothetical protein
MASKLAVAGIIEGNFTDEGLAAMSDCADMTTALARELTQGIKNEVEDLSAVFKKMAILKPEPNLIQVTPECTESVLSKKVAQELFSDFSVTEVSPITIPYAPPETEVMQKFKQFKDMFNSSSIPDSVLLKMVESMLKAGNKPVTRMPPWFDPFAEEAA